MYKLFIVQIKMVSANLLPSFFLMAVVGVSGVINQKAHQKTSQRRIDADLCQQY